MKKLIATSIILSVISSSLFGQNYRENFFKVINTNDTVEAERIINEWKLKTPDDPEIYVAYFNFYAKKSMLNVLMLGDNPQGKEALVITDPDSTKKEPVAYMYDETIYDYDILKIGLAYIDTAIRKYPDRLDMRFGKIYMLGQIKNYDDFTKDIGKAIDHAAVIKNNWKWTSNEPVKDSQAFFLGNIQSYVIQLYGVGEVQSDNIRSISETVLKYYPDHVESLSDLSIAYSMKKDYDHALIPLLKAQKLAPTDYIVIANIADCYYQKGDKANAIKYYELLEKYGDADAIEFAKEQLIALKKK